MLCSEKLEVTGDMAIDELKTSKLSSVEMANDEGREMRNQAAALGRAPANNAAPDSENGG